MKSMNKIWLSALFGIAALSFGACDDNDEVIYKENPTDGPVVSRLNVSPRNVTMGFIDEKEFTVAVRPVDTPITWESSDPSIAYVDENNKIVPVACGEVEITAKAGSLTDKVTLKIHSSIVLGTYEFMESGQTSAVPTLQVFPEGTPYTITSSNEEVVSVSGTQVTGAAAGISTLNIKTDDEQEANITIGIVDNAHTVTATKAEAYSYKGDVLGHAAYDISALTLAPASASYADGGTWSGTGSGLFLKLYRNAAQASIPDGTYTPGTSVFNFFTEGKSYVIDAATDTKEEISYGKVEIAADGVSAKVITGSHAWSFNFSGTRTETPHHYEYESLTDSYTNADFPNGTVDIDHKGEYFYGGVGNAWRFRLRFADNTYIQIHIWARKVNEVAAEYPVDGGWCSPGTIGAMGYGYTSLWNHYGNAYFKSGGTLQTPGFARTTEGDIKYVTLGFKGSLTYDASESVAEIGESRSVPGTVNLDVTDYKFTVANETALP